MTATSHLQHKRQLLDKGISKRSNSKIIL
jgi:hypothetical protein